MYLILNRDLNLNSNSQQFYNEKPSFKFQCKSEAFFPGSYVCGVSKPETTKEQITDCLPFKNKTQLDDRSHLIPMRNKHDF